MSRQLKRPNLRGKQNGFNLIELMIAILIGLIILSAVLALFVSMMGSNNANLKSIRLNHELRSTMSLITRDIRRAGANRNAASDTLAMLANPFSVAGTTRLTITPSSPIGAGTITFSYDEANDGTVETFGYRRDNVNNTVQFCDGTATVASCTAGWEAITDNNLVNINFLSFVASTITEGTINIRQITTTMTGNLIRDTGVSRTISETVKIRNDEFD